MVVDSSHLKGCRSHPWSTRTAPPIERCCSSPTTKAAPTLARPSSTDHRRSTRHARSQRAPKSKRYVARATSEARRGTSERGRGLEGSKDTHLVDCGHLWPCPVHPAAAGPTQVLVLRCPDCLSPAARLSRGDGVGAPANGPEDRRSRRRDHATTCLQVRSDGTFGAGASTASQLKDFNRDQMGL